MLIRKLQKKLIDKLNLTYVFSKIQVVFLEMLKVV